MVESTQLAMGSNRETTQELIGTSMPRELLVDPERALERLLGPPSKLVQPGGLVVEGVTGVYRCDQCLVFKCSSRGDENLKQVAMSIQYCIMVHFVEYFCDRCAPM